MLTLLIAGAAGWYFFIQDSGNTPYEPQVDTDMIAEVADSDYDDEAMDDGFRTADSTEVNQGSADTPEGQGTAQGSKEKACL